jgi:hypothetical protein
MTRIALYRGHALKLAGLASLLFAGAGAHGKTVVGPLVQCQPAIFDGVPVCAVDMAEYAQVGGAGPVQCPSGVSSTGKALLCEESFAAAIADAALFFNKQSQPAAPYVINIEGGSFDLSSETATLAGLNGAIDVSGIAPSGGGCLADGAAATGVVGLSGNPCLVISGAGPGATILTTATGNPAVFGKNVSHIMVENMTMVQPNQSTTQGTYVSQGTQSVHGVAYPTLTLDIAAGFPTPLGLYNIMCANNGAVGCSRAGWRTLSNPNYMRAYTNTATPQLIQSTSSADSNAQNPWGFPSVKGVIQAAVKPTQPEPASFPNRWTLTLNQSLRQRAVPSAYSATTAGAMNLICMKIDDANAFSFDDRPGGGTDIVMNNMVWIGAARGTFRGIRGALTGGGLGAQVYNSSIERGPAVGGQVPCLSTQSGGIQIGQPSDPPIYGNVVYGLNAEGTGDDSVALFNDIGGMPNGNGGTYPQTVVAQSSIGNSFARDIVLTNSHQYSGMVGNLAVLVDAFTQGRVNDDGNCDPLVLGNGNCPVTYVTY